MKAVVYKEPYTVAVEEVDDPRVEAPGDAIVKITSAAGSVRFQYTSCSL